MSRISIRRILLWALPILGLIVGLPWAIRDLVLLADFYGIRWIAYPQRDCTKNLVVLATLVVVWFRVTARRSTSRKVKNFGAASRLASELMPVVYFSPHIRRKRCLGQFLGFVPCPC